MAKLAVIQTGGKQHLVSEGAVITIETLPDAVLGSKLTFDQVMLLDDGSATKIGAPVIAGAKVTGEVVEAGRAPKITVIHYRQKSRHFNKKGHRQNFLKVKIGTIA